jgi:hypothetical protein
MANAWAARTGDVSWADRTVAAIWLLRSSCEALHAAPAGVIDHVTFSARLDEQAEPGFLRLGTLIAERYHLRMKVIAADEDRCVVRMSRCRGTTASGRQTLTLSKFRIDWLWHQVQSRLNKAENPKS